MNKNFFRNFDSAIILPVSLALFVLSAFFFLHKVGGSDLFWQLKIGELISKTYTIPYIDVFSYTAAGEIWINHEWLSEVVFYLVYSFAGFGALSVFSFVLGLILSLVLFFSFSKLSDSISLSLALTFFVIFIGAPRFQQLRPELFGFIFFGILLIIIITAYQDREWLFWFVPPVFILWANFHGSVIVGVIVFILSCVGIRMWKGRCVSRNLMILSLLAPLFNPYVQRIYTFPVEDCLFSHAVDLSGWGLIVLCVFSIFLIIKHYRRFSIFIPIAIFFLIPGMLMTRLVPFSAIMLSFLVAWFFPKGSQESCPKLFQLVVILSLILMTGVPMLLFNGGPLYGVQKRAGGIDFVLGPGMGVGLNNEDFPIEAVNFIEGAHLRKNMFNDMAYGGYIIWRGWPYLRVFVDTRAPIYGDMFIKEYTDALFSKNAFDKVAKKYDIGFVIYDARQMNVQNDPLRFLFDNSGWDLKFASSNANVFVKK